MAKVNVICIVGLWCDPSGDCQGWRPFIESLRGKYAELDNVVYASYLNDVKQLDSIPAIVLGHSKGGHAAYVRAKRSPAATRSLIMVEPVNALPDTIDGPFEDYDAIAGITQRCFYSTLPFHLGHQYRDSKLNVSLPFDHNGCCRAPATLEYIESEIARVAALSETP